MPSKKISIIIPVHNEEKNITLLIKELKLILKQEAIINEVIVIDDGSTDSTLQKLILAKKILPSLHIISLRTRQGKATALSIGFSKAKGKIVITMDGDLQDNPKEIPRFIKKVEEGYDLVSGWKIKRLDPQEKLIASKVYNFVTKKISGVELHDMNCGFKAYKAELAKELHLYGEMHRYIPIFAHHMGFSITEIAVNHRMRKAGLSKYKWGRYFYGLFDLITVLYLTRFNQKPLHIFGFLGLLFTTCGMTISTYLTVLKIVTGAQIGNRPLLLLGVLLIIVGIQVTIFGLLGEQLTYLNSNRNKDILIKSIN